MNDWYIFDGKGPKKSFHLPAPPKWRQFYSDENMESWNERRGKTFVADDKEIQMVNAAIYLRRPLLITGNPGAGKSTLAYAVAHQLNLGKVLKWPITTRTTLQDGLYQYDAIGRLQELQILRYKNPNDEISASIISDIGKYIKLGPLGTAFLPNDKPRVLLIDEIDKSDIDLPNDLLHIFEEGCFEIPELSRLAEESVEVFLYDSNMRTKIQNGIIECKEFPIIILTSNKERELPAPFLRRCLRLDIGRIERNKLEAIVEEHFKKTVKMDDKIKIIDLFEDMREKGKLSTDQLLNAIYMIMHDIDISSEDKDMKSLREAIFRSLTNL